MFMFIGVGIGFTFVPRLFKADPLNYGLSIVGSIFFLIGTICFAGVADDTAGFDPDFYDFLMGFGHGGFR